MTVKRKRIAGILCILLGLIAWAAMLYAALAMGGYADWLRGSLFLGMLFLTVTGCVGGHILMSFGDEERKRRLR